MPNWDAALDRAMEKYYIQQDLRQEKIDEALQSEEHDPYIFLHVSEAISSSPFSKEQEKEFEELLRARDIKALDMIIEASIQFQTYYIEKSID
jgi:hypothetical protein